MKIASRRALGRKSKMATNKTLTVLVIEDENLHREGLAYLLERAGYAISAARSGEEAVAHLTVGPTPDLILLDLKMPGMDGAEFRKIQLSTEKWASIPVVVVSGAPEIDEVSRSMKVDGWVRKPPVLENFLTTVRIALAKRRAREVA
jgi:CheY-like chemotaxis protein